MKPYSKDLRLKVLAAVDRGMPRGEVTGTFSVSPATVKRWLEKRRETGDVDPEPIPSPPARKREALEERLPAQTEPNPTSPSPSSAGSSRRKAAWRFPPLP